MAFAQGDNSAKPPWEYLRFSDDVQANQIVARFNSLNSTERKAVTIDYLIMATGADVHISGE